MRDLVPIEVIQIFSTENGLLNNAERDEVVDLKTMANSGVFALHWQFDTTLTHASARVDFHAYVSATGKAGTFVRASYGHVIVADAHEASGTDEDGNTCGVDVKSFRLPLSGYLKIRATETATQNASFDAWLISQ